MGGRFGPRFGLRAVAALAILTASAGCDPGGGTEASTSDTVPPDLVDGSPTPASSTPSASATDETDVVDAGLSVEVTGVLHVTADEAEVCADPEVPCFGLEVGADVDPALDGSWVRISGQLVDGVLVAVWPSGCHAARDPIRIYESDGVLVATEGDLVTAGGGFHDVNDLGPGTETCGVTASDGAFVLGHPEH
jgi:hypothetical protein